MSSLRHLRGQQDQLSLEVGVPDPEAPRYPTIAFTGTMDLKAPNLGELALDIGDEVTIRIGGPDGTILASGIGRIGSVPIIEHEETSASPAWIERRHKAKVKPG